MGRELPRDADGQRWRLRLVGRAHGSFRLRDAQRAAGTGAAGPLEKLVGGLLRRVFKYFNPIMGAFEGRWWSRIVRFCTVMAFTSLGWLFADGLRNYRNLKPIDYGPPYRFRWDFHFWAFPVESFVERTLPAFMAFYRDFRAAHPDFDERGLLACYRVRKDDRTLLSPSHDGDAITLDPVRPMSRDPQVTAMFDTFCAAYNSFAVQHGGRCTFNQTKVLGREHVVGAFGERWNQFAAARQSADPEGRFLSPYFAGLLPAPASGSTRALRD